MSEQATTNEAAEPKVGDRVIVIESADKETVTIYGYGVYQGRVEAPFGPLGLTIEQYAEKAKQLGIEYAPFMCALIVLDGGEKVWGRSCWWAPESKAEQLIAGRRVVVAAAPELKNGDEDD